MRIALITCGTLELLFAVAALGLIASDIQIIIALVAFGFALTHFGLAAGLKSNGQKGTGHV